MGARLHRPCLDHDSRCRLLLRRPPSSEKCPLYDLGIDDDTCRRFLPGAAPHFHLVHLARNADDARPSLCVVVFLGVGAHRFQLGGTIPLILRIFDRFSLAFSDTADKYIGDLSEFFPFARPLPQNFLPSSAGMISAGDGGWGFLSST